MVILVGQFYRYYAMFYYSNGAYHEGKPVYAGR